MSKQLTLSSILAVLAMAGTAVLATTAEHRENIDAASHMPIAQQAADSLHAS